MPNTAIIIQKIRAVYVPDANSPRKIIEEEIAEPDPGSVRIKVQACGVCHSDMLVKEGVFSGISGKARFRAVLTTGHDFHMQHGGPP